MKQNQLFRVAIVGVLWLCVGAGCQKDPPEPSCWGNQRTKFIKRLEGARADFGGSGFWFQDVLIEANGNRLTSSMVCFDQWDELSKLTLKNNFTLENNRVRLVDSTRVYPYRVWGVLYELPDIINIGPIPTLAFRLDKVEEIK